MEEQPKQRLCKYKSESGSGDEHITYQMGEILVTLGEMIY